MRLIKMLSTEELKDYIEENLKKIRNKNYNIREKINFIKNIQNCPEGIYVFSDFQGYHYVYSERGNESIHKVTDDLFEITYWILSAIISTLAFEYATEHRVEGKSFREIAFVKKLEIMAIIGENYVKREEIEISEILEINPL